MIRIYGDWVADVYERGYIVGKVGTTFDRRLGRDREIIPHPNYFYDLSDAVEYAYRAILREEIGKKRKDIMLEDTIEIMRDVERKMHVNIASLNVLIEERSLASELEILEQRVKALKVKVK